jgi:N utilization substance protein B
MRLAAYEMLFSDDVPFSIAINEAVELAKKYDHDKAPKFINGILNTIAVKKGLKGDAKAEAPAEADGEKSE